MTLPRVTQTGGCQAGPGAPRATAPAQPALVCPSVELAWPDLPPPAVRRWPGAPADPDSVLWIPDHLSSACSQLPVTLEPRDPLTGLSHPQDDPAAQSLTAGSKGAAGCERGFRGGGLRAGAGLGGKVVSPALWFG